MPILELKLYPPSDSYSQVALLYDKTHWTWHDGESARVALAYDPSQGGLAWWERTRSGPTGEWVKTSFSSAVAAAETDPKIVDDMRRATNRMVKLANLRIAELQADGSPEALKAAEKLRGDLRSGRLRTRAAPKTARRKR